MMNDFLELHKEWIRESNLIEDVDDPKADEDAFNAWRRFTEEPISRESILRCHADLLWHLNRRIAGRFRDCNVRVGRYIAPDWKRVPNLMERWLYRYALQTKEDAIKHAHIAFESIHPFEDGNGRVGRMLMNYQRLKAGHEVLCIYARDRHRYYEWFTSERAQDLRRAMTREA